MKLTQTEMFLIADQVSEWLEERLGQDVLFKRDVDALSLSMGSPKKVLSPFGPRGLGQPFLPGFSILDQFMFGNLNVGEYYRMVRGDVERTLSTS